MSGGRVGHVDDLEPACARRDGYALTAAGNVDRGVEGADAGDHARLEPGERVEDADPLAAVRHHDQVVTGADRAGVSRGVDGGDQAGPDEDSVEGVSSPDHLGSVLQPVAVGVLDPGVGSNDPLAEIGELITVEVLAGDRPQDGLGELGAHARVRRREVDPADSEGARVDHPAAIARIREQDQVAESGARAAGAPALLELARLAVLNREVEQAFAGVRGLLARGQQSCATSKGFLAAAKVCQEAFTWTPLGRCCGLAPRASDLQAPTRQ